jgi:hypothetical protein
LLLFDIKADLFYGEWGSKIGGTPLTHLFKSTGKLCIYNICVLFGGYISKPVNRRSVGKTVGPALWAAATGKSSVIEVGYLYNGLM